MSRQAVIDESKFNVLDGVAYPRISAILDTENQPYLHGWWRHMVCKHGKGGFLEVDRVLETASKVGTEVHARVFEFFKKEEPLFDATDPEVDCAFTNFTKFADEYKPEMIEGELKLFYQDSITHTELWNNFESLLKYSGTMDWYGTVIDEGTKKHVIIDWKSSSKIKTARYVLQGEAYHAALKRGYPTYEVDEIWIVRLAKKETINFIKDVVKVKPNPVRFNYFLNLVENYHYEELFI